MIIGGDDAPTQSTTTISTTVSNTAIGPSEDAEISELKAEIKRLTQELEDANRK